MLLREDDRDDEARSSVRAVGRIPLIRRRRGGFVGLTEAAVVEVEVAAERVAASVGSETGAQTDAGVEAGVVSVLLPLPPAMREGGLEDEQQSCVVEADVGPSRSDCMVRMKSASMAGRMALNFSSSRSTLDSPSRSAANRRSAHLRVSSSMSGNASAIAVGFWHVSPSLVSTVESSVDADADLDEASSCLSSLDELLPWHPRGRESSGTPSCGPSTLRTDE